MSQHYPDPNTVLITCKKYPPTRRLKAALVRDGQIVPLLVRDSEGAFYVDDIWQAERLLALRELGWPTVLVETEWSEDDL